jgi:hypothetical protein
MSPSNIKYMFYQINNIYFIFLEGKKCPYFSPIVEFGRKLNPPGDHILDKGKIVDIIHEQ